VHQRLPINVGPVGIRSCAVPGILPVVHACGELNRAAAVQWAHESVLDRLVALQVCRRLLRKLVDLVTAVLVLLAGEDGSLAVQRGQVPAAAEVEDEENDDAEEEQAGDRDADSEPGAGAGGEFAFCQGGEVEVEAGDG